MPWLKKATSSLSPDRRLVVLVSGKGWVQPLPGITHSKHVLRRCPSVRCGADMADTLSASTSSVTMRPRESLRFVTEAHRHLSPVCEAGCTRQPQRRSTALAESHHMKACASQDGSRSAVALGVGLASLTHRGWHLSSTAIGDPQLRQNYITPHFVKWSPAATLKLRLVSPTAFAP